MAVSESGLAMLFITAVVLSSGLFVSFNDGGKTNAVLGFVGAAFWILFGISALSVRTVDLNYATATEAMMPLVYAGIGMGIAVSFFALQRLMEALRNDTPGTTGSGGLLE
jgi:hypothetical protein